MHSNTASQSVPSTHEEGQQQPHRTQSEILGQSEYHAGTTADFFRSCFGSVDAGYLTLFNKPQCQSGFVSIANPSWQMDAAQTALELSRGKQNVYFGIGLQQSRPETGRGKANGVIRLPGLWADIDVRGPGHAQNNLPITVGEALSIIDAVPFEPSVVVYTGGGIQPYWLFKEPLEIESEEDRQAANALTNNFQQHLASVAARSGWQMDRTADLARLLRLPGTWNHKYNPPALVRYDKLLDYRYNPSEFRDFLEIRLDIKTLSDNGRSSDKPIAQVGPILAGCEWMRHCKDDAASLPEPEWYRMLSILARCRGGRDAAHELSRPYARYSEQETGQKFDQAVSASGPATCDFIQNQLGQGRYCARCQHLGHYQEPRAVGNRKGRIE